MKRITIIFLLLCLLQTAGCAQPMSKQPVKKDTIMQQSREVERYDFEATKNGTEAVVIEQDGWIIEKSSMWPSGPFYNEYAPAKDFYEIQKLFYPSGIMRTKTAFLGMLQLISLMARRESFPKRKSL